MAGLQFVPTSCAYIKIDIADKENTHISVPIEHINSYKRCTLLETGEFLDSMEGQLYMCTDSSKDKQELKNEGYVGYLSYAEGVEAGSYILQIHITEEEFNRIIHIISNSNDLVQINIETPLHGKNLRYGTSPDDPIEWSVKENNWVHIEKCDFTFEFSKSEKH